MYNAYEGDDDDDRDGVFNFKSRPHVRHSGGKHKHRRVQQATAAPLTMTTSSQQTAPSIEHHGTFFYSSVSRTVHGGYDASNNRHHRNRNHNEKYLHTFVDQNGKRSPKRLTASW